MRASEKSRGDTLIYANYQDKGESFRYMMTALSDRKQVEALAGKILAHNGECVSHNGTEIPVNLRAGAVMLKQGKLSYSELFSEPVSAPGEEGTIKF